MEMRRELRYRLDIPAACFPGKTCTTERLYAEGITRDISVLGAFIVSPTCPPVETQVEVEVLLPPLRRNEICRSDQGRSASPPR